ncbi:cell division protein FtsZ [Bacillus mexicanus]|uniref:cell division protein FtsZ n=1 Tax=Bacillus mexicanus TaxID=2834415 RepID=UPI003D193438
MAKEKERNNKSDNAVIKIVGVGGAGCNAVNRMIEDEISGVEYIVINTDNQVLENMKGAKTVLIGSKTTRGLGAGANPEIGKKAAEENREDIRQAVEGADLVFVTAGMGGGTGTGAASVVAHICRDLDILTIGVVTLPFTFEGRKRMRVAQKGRKETFKNVDTLITIPNDKILESLDENERSQIGVEDAFRLADSVLAKSAVSISNLVNKTGHINLDYADFRTAVKVGGSALMGTGMSKGDQAVIKAAKQAMTNPLLTHGITGAKAIIMNFTSKSKLSFMDVQKAAMEIEQHADEEAEILYGHVIVDEDDKEWEDERVEVTIVATGFEDELTETEAPKMMKNSSVDINHRASNDQMTNSASDIDLKVNTSTYKGIETVTQNNGYNSFKEIEDELKQDIEVPSFLRRKRV